MVEKIIKNVHSKEGTLNLTFYIYIVKFLISEQKTEHVT